MSPSEFLHDKVAAYHDLPDMYRMITAYLIVLDTLILALITICIQRVSVYVLLNGFSLHIRRG